jgi:hypothetical protein
LLIEIFVVSNLGFLGLDIALAHAENAFRRGEEWLPLGFSLLVTLLLAPGLLSRRLRIAMRRVAIAVGGGAVILGVAGMIYHLESAFFEKETLANLVYAAPFVAPLSYVGVGLLLIMSRLEDPEGGAYAEWTILLALGGFVGNFGLSVLDHAQNGFFHASEWIPVAGGAFGSSFLLIALLRVGDRGFARLTLLVLGAACAVGVAGFVLHFLANLARPGASWTERVLYGAPAFAPLLFADLALLAAIGLWARSRALRAGTPPRP